MIDGVCVCAIKLCMIYQFDKRNTASHIVGWPPQPQDRCSNRSLFYPIAPTNFSLLIGRTSNRSRVPTMRVLTLANPGRNISIYEIAAKSGQFKYNLINLIENASL